MYWTIGQFPELHHLEPDERAEVLRRVPWWTYPIIVIRAVIPAAIVSAVIPGLIWRGRTPDAVKLEFALIAGLLATGLYLWQLERLRKLIRREIAGAFRGQRPPFCLACGYNLRGSTAPLCPECGQAIGGE